MRSRCCRTGLFDLDKNFPHQHDGAGKDPVPNTLFDWFRLTGQNVLIHRCCTLTDQTIGGDELPGTDDEGVASLQLGKRGFHFNAIDQHPNRAWLLPEDIDQTLARLIFRARQQFATERGHGKGAKGQAIVATGDDAGGKAQIDKFRRDLAFLPPGLIGITTTLPGNVKHGG